MDTQAVKALLQHGAAADTWSSSGQSALMLAASRGKLQIMEMLMAEEARGGARKAAAPNVADVKLTDVHRWTPLMHAASADRAEAVRLLLKFGSEVSPSYCQVHANRCLSHSWCHVHTSAGTHA
jgi:ankyrin repeat protein